MRTEEDDRAEAIGIVDLLADAVGRLRDAWWVALLAIAAGLGAGEAIATLLPMDMRPGVVQFTPAYFARVILGALTTNLSMALALQYLLDPKAARPRLGRRYIACVLVLTLFELAKLPLMVAINPAYAAPSGPTAIAMRGAFVGAANAVVAFVALKFCLWPVGQLTGRRDMTPGRSWALMRGATLSSVVILAGLAMLPATLQALAVWIPTQENAQAVWGYLQWVQWVWREVVAMVALAISAAIYARRLDDRRAVADVFA